jgi:formate-dependent phosphoribosylglycinamide formyltransferase (GAR transformylase)
MVRLAMALNDAGFTLDAVCLPRHPLQKTKAAHKTYAYDSLAPLRSLASAITASSPDLIIPGDDPATMQLHALYERESKRGRKGALICSVIERSLGSPSSFPQVYARTGLLEIAQEEGIRVPRTEVLTDINQLREWGARTGFPAVLKSNGSSGGEGVRIVHSLEKAERAFRTLQAPPLLARALKRALIDGDKTLILPSLLRRRSGLNIQEYVAGQEATSTVACWQGTLLAGLHFEVLNKTTPTGPASVMRLIDSCEMSIAAEKIVRRLNLSGIVGLDFMLEEQTGNPYLIEVNPRATQVGHLTLGSGRDLPAALYAALTGEVIREAPKITENRTIALFPQEWKRNPESSFLQSGYHDVPWEEPELIRAFANSAGKHAALNFEKERVQVLPPLELSNR